jgi:hypothetical protein
MLFGFVGTLIIPTNNIRNALRKRKKNCIRQKIFLKSNSDIAILPVTFLIMHLSWMRSNQCQIKGKHSLDRISLDLFTRSKVSVKFGIWSNALFVTRSKVLIMNFYILSFDRIISHVFTRLKVLLMSFWVIFNFRSSEKIRPFFFGTCSKVLIMVFLALLKLSI